MKKICTVLKKFKTLSPVAKTSIALIIAKFFQTGLSFISSPIFTRIMPSAEYGVISTFTSWQSVIFIIASLNMSQGVFNNGMLEFKEDRDSFTFSIMILANMITLSCIMLYIIFYRVLEPLIDMPQILMIIMFSYFWFTPAYNYWLGRSRYEYRYKALLAVTVTVSLCAIIGSVILVFLAKEGDKAIAKLIGTEAVSIVVGMFFYFYIIKNARGQLRFKYCKYAIKIQLPLVPHYLSMYVLSSSDRIMITKLANTSATAIYSVAYTVASVVLIFWNAVDAAYASWIYQKMEEKNYKALQERAQQVIILFAFVVAFITLFAPEIISILGPKEYYEGVYIIPSIVAGVFFIAIFSLYMRVELYLKKSSAIMIATIGAAVFNLILNYIFIPKAGYWAAGYTTMVCYIMLAVFHALNLKHEGYGNVYNNKVIVILSIGVCLLIIFVSFSYRYTLIRYGLILTLVAIGYKKRKFLLAQMRKSICKKSNND